MWLSGSKRLQSVLDLFPGQPTQPALLVRKRMPAMGKLPIKNGTPVGSVSLCKTCSYAQIMTGFRESELITICHNPSPTLFVPFNVYECTRYYDKNRPSWSQMKKLAIDVVPGTLKP